MDDQWIYSCNRAAPRVTSLPCPLLWVVLITLTLLLVLIVVAPSCTPCNRVVATISARVHTFLNERTAEPCLALVLGSALSTPPDTLSLHAGESHFTFYNVRVFWS